MAHALWGHFRLARGRLASSALRNDDNDKSKSMATSSINTRYKPAYYAKHFPLKLRGLEVHFRNWATRVFAVVDGKVGYTPGTLMHLWHGERANRQYDQRFKCLMNGRFDPQTDVRVGDQGVWEWTLSRADGGGADASKKSEMQRCVKSLFAQRAEDG
jgi:hypothetical protein